VDVNAELDAPCPPQVLFATIDDLGAYPQWLSIVPRAEPAPAHESGADEGPAWFVELRGSLGPLARSKRLRMVRTTSEAPRVVRFERREHDGRDHSPWVLEGQVEPTETGSRLTMRLHYGGTFGGSMVERMLSQEIEESKPRLLALVAG